MAMTVCVDALVYWNGAALPSRNETSVKQSADVAEAKPFVASVAQAYATKMPTWKSWTVTLNGYYDTLDDTVQNAIKNGTVAQIVIYPTRTDLANYWSGSAFCTSADMTINSSDYAELNAEFEGTGVLTWTNTP